jgi:hypothetical protein
MTVWDRSNTARRGARVATGQFARRQALIDDVENFLLASRSSFARLLSPDEGTPPSPVRHQRVSTRVSTRLSGPGFSKEASSEALPRH